MQKAVLLALASLALAARAEEKVDLATVHRIKAEAFQNSKVMDHLFWLTDVNGPRLTGSPGYRAAAEWAMQTLAGVGAHEPHLESWGPFGRGWSLSRFSAHLLSPAYAPLNGMPKAWSAGTDGPVSGELVLAPLFLHTEREERLSLEKIGEHIQKFIAAHKGKLRGKIVLIDQVRDLEQPAEVSSRRHDDARLAALALAPEPVAAQPLQWPLKSVPADIKKRQALFVSTPLEVVADYFHRVGMAYDPLWAFLRDEGALAIFGTDDRGDGGYVFVESTGAYRADAPIPPPYVVFPPETYDRLARLQEKKVPVKVELEVQARFHDEGKESFNVVAEIPGTSKKDEVVMLGAHLDSWHAGTGATDNAAGSAVMIEAIRILKELKLPMARTVRIALWSGEEQGLFGSRAYVKQHFGDPVTMQLKPEHEKLSVYFNLDNGTGKIRGVYLQGNDMARPLFEKWLAPFKDHGASTIAIRNTGGTDHQSFDSVGLPGFQFIQDPLDYMTRTHHSDMDVYEHASAADLMQASAIVASFVYQAATRDELFPRKPLPKPLPPQAK